MEKFPYIIGPSEMFHLSIYGGRPLLLGAACLMHKCVGRDFSTAQDSNAHGLRAVLTKTLHVGNQCTGSESKTNEI